MDMGTNVKRGRGRDRNADVKRHNNRCKEQVWAKRGILNADGTSFTLKDYARHFELQNGRCKLATCNKHQSELEKALAVDHDHETGFFRGLLCDICNYHKVRSLTLVEALEIVAYLKQHSSGA